MLAGRDLGPDVILKRLSGIVVRRRALAQHDMRFDDLAAGLVGGPDNRAFGNARVRQQDGFDLGAGDVAARR